MAWSRLVMVAVAVICFVAMMVWGGFFVTGNTDAIRLIAPLLGIMTGFLIAIITASSDPKHLLPGSWRVANAHRHEVERALSRYQCLFFIYLAAIAAAFTTILVGASVCPPCLIGPSVARSAWSQPPSFSHLACHR